MSSKGVLVQRREAGQIGEGDPSLHGKDHAEEFLEEGALTFTDVDVENGLHLCEHEVEHSLQQRLCLHRS